MRSLTLYGKPGKMTRRLAEPSTQDG
jgi:hypothetical protein